MLQFNNTHIITGYIKQLLASYNLTKYRVYKDGIPVIPSDTNGSVYYVKDGFVQRYYSEIEDWQTIQPFAVDGRIVNSDVFNQGILDLNHTRNLIIKNNRYDTYTHEYLGDYLRFMRDYFQIDLMGAYNCFSDSIIDDLSFEVMLNNGSKAIFNTADSQYKFYAVPVRLFNTYTIAIDCQQGIQFCCALYNSRTKLPEVWHKAASGETNDVNEWLRKQTYAKLSGLMFGTPKLYTKLSKLTPANAPWLTKIANREQDLYMIIKMPASNKSSITILEGDYAGNNDTALISNKLIRNRAALNADYADQLPSKVFITPRQLLKANTGKSYPFADRLIEYLVGNAITSQDMIADNVKRIEAVLKGNPTREYTGMWQNIFRVAFYQFISKQPDTAVRQFYDYLGWVDKDVQLLFKKRTNGTEYNLIDINLYQQLYKASGR